VIFGAKSGSVPDGRRGGNTMGIPCGHQGRHAEALDAARRRGRSLPRRRLQWFAKIRLDDAGSREGRRCGRSDDARPT
jgi:hypothetical protein